jgi:hypothetical protein
MMKNLKRFSAQWLNKKIILLLPAVLTVLFFVFPKQNLLAQTSLTIGTAPASEKLTLQPGEKYEGEIVVWNLSETTTTYDIFVRGFRQIEDQPGTAIMFTEEEEQRALYSAASWVTISKQKVDLIPNRNEKIFYEINVPKDVTKGEYTVIIAFISENIPQQLRSTAAFTSLSSGTPILIKVGEDFAENAELLQFETDKDWYEQPNVKFLTRINNLGDTHITPIGEIVLTNLFDQEVGKIVFNESAQSILRDNSASYETVWNYGSFLSKENKLILGPIKADLIVMYRNFQPGFAPLTATTSFWIIPWKYILLLLLIVITTVVVLKMRKKKKENQPRQLPK